MSKLSNEVDALMIATAGWEWDAHHEAVLHQFIKGSSKRYRAWVCHPAYREWLRSNVRVICDWVEAKGWL